MLNWDPLFLTFKLAVISTAILFVFALPISIWLSRSKAPYRPIIEALVSMPLVLPPTVLGFYLLIAFSPGNSFGRFLDEAFGLRLVFSFEGLVVASVIYSLPFMVNPLQSGLKSLPTNLLDASYLLGKSKWQTLIHVQLPNIKNSIIMGWVLTFAHTIGEFGVVLMIGGSIPGETKVVSISIYDQVESMNYGMAHQYSFILFSITFLILMTTYMLNGRVGLRLWK